MHRIDSNIEDFLKLFADSGIADDFSVPFFYAPPFVLDFNTNSSICLGQNFTFHCQVEPSNYGINVTLYRHHPRSSSDQQSDNDTEIDSSRLQVGRFNPLPHLYPPPLHKCTVLENSHDMNIQHARAVRFARARVTASPAG